MPRLSLSILASFALALLGPPAADATHTSAIDPSMLHPGGVTTLHTAHWSWVETPPTDAPTRTPISYFVHSGAHGGAAMTAGQIADIAAAAGIFNSSGANLVLTLAASDAAADIHVHMDTTSACGAGALGCAAFAAFGHGLAYTDAHPQHKMASNTAFPGIQTLTMYDDATFAGTWYSGAAGGIGGGQFDFLTVAIQEIGHHLGLEHNDSGAGHGDFASSPLNGLLPIGNATRRALTVSDVAAITHLYGAAVPEPTTGLLLLVGLAAGAATRRRRLH